MRKITETEKKETPSREVGRERERESPREGE